ncbi:MAG: aa3-type cytochrome c oxidase subunit IV [Pseudomonadota bacterium]
MASSNHVHGEMEISEQERTWNGFLTGTLWGSFLIALILAYAVFTVALGMNWMVALGLCAVAGIGGGLLMGMGGAWIAAVAGLVALAVIIQIIITIFSALT